MNLNIDSSKEDVAQFLKNKFNLNEKALAKISDEEINGEALTLLLKNDYKLLEIKTQERNKIMKVIEKDILKLNDNIKQNNTYKYIYEENLNNLWNSLDNFISKLKLGEKLIFIKYILIRDPPPEREKIDDLSKYLKKVFKEEEFVKSIIESLDDLLTYNVDQLEEICEEWEFSNIDILKLRIIIELMKKNKNKFKNLKKEDNMISKDNINYKSFETNRCSNPNGISMVKNEKELNDVEPAINNWKENFKFDILKKCSIKFHTNLKGEEPFIIYDVILCGDYNIKIDFTELMDNKYDCEHSQQRNELSENYLKFFKFLKEIEEKINK